MKLQKKEIEHIAKLARLHLTEEEKEKYTKELSAILGYIDQLKEVDVTDVMPTAQVTGLFNIWREDEINEWNEDERQSTIKEASSIEENLIKVKRILE